MSKTVKIIVTSLLLVPTSVVITFLLIPFWSWLEKHTGIESVGHSGPSEWCFVITIAIVFGGYVVIRLQKKASNIWSFINIGHCYGLTINHTETVFIFCGFY